MLIDDLFDNGLISLFRILSVFSQLACGSTPKDIQNIWRYTFTPESLLRRFRLCRNGDACTKEVTSQEYRADIVSHNQSDIIRLGTQILGHSLNESDATPAKYPESLRLMAKTVWQRIREI
jgi:hypothetical protein